MFKYGLLFIICVGFSEMGLYAQIGNIIDAQVSSEKSTILNNETRFSTARLAKQITKNNRTDFEKAQAIFIWIAKNIDYDNELRTNIKLQKSIYTSEENVLKSVLKRKKALCGGYAFLYKELCKQVGIESHIIHGFSKKYNNTSTKRKQADHTWNAVKINGTWRLLDITLARSQQINNEPNLYWFDTNPDFFIKTHYPVNIQWSFIQDPISRKEFETPSLK